MFSTRHLQFLPLSSQRMMGRYRLVQAFTALSFETVICSQRHPETLPAWYRYIDDTVTSLRNRSGKRFGSEKRCNAGWSPAAVWTLHPPLLWSNSDDDAEAEWAQHESYYYTQHDVSEESQSRTLAKTKHIASLAKTVTLYKEDDDTNKFGVKRLGFIKPSWTCTCS